MYKYIHLFQNLLFRLSRDDSTKASRRHLEGGKGMSMAKGVGG